MLLVWQSIVESAVNWSESMVDIGSVGNYYTIRNNRARWHRVLWNTSWWFNAVQLTLLLSWHLLFIWFRSLPQLAFAHSNPSYLLILHSSTSWAPKALSPTMSSADRLSSANAQLLHCVTSLLVLASHAPVVASSRSSAVDSPPN